MAMRSSLLSKLKALTPRSSAAARKDMLLDKRPLFDPSKYGSIKELNEALPELLDKRSKAEQEAFDRYLKAYDRVTYAIAAGGFSGIILLGAYLLDPDA